VAGVDAQTVCAEVTAFTGNAETDTVVMAIVEPHPFVPVTV
jgi:hypothetical protein